MTDTGTIGGLYATATTESISADRAARLWEDRAQAIRSGPLMRELIRKGMHADEAADRVRTLTRSITAAAGALAEAGRCLHSITVDVDVIHDDTHDTSLKTGSGL